MNKKYYLIHIQYLGFRYHGWQRQPGVKTIESVLYKTLTFVLKNKSFKFMGCSRTDAMVSAEHSAFELFLNEPVDTIKFLEEFNLNLPNDIRATEIEEVDETFNIIQAPRTKEYLYLFAYGEKSHPFCASLMYSVPYNLDICLMKQGAKLYEGYHHFRKYCTKPGQDTVFDREIVTSMIEDNNQFTASFFPEKSYVYRIEAKGFLRYQVRLIMGQLFALGKGEISLNTIQESLKAIDDKPLRHIAPASGLILNKISFVNEEKPNNPGYSSIK